MSRRTEIQVGLTVLVAIAILIGSLAWLKDYSVARGKRIWRVEFPETGGLAASDEVLVNGIRKGNVRAMKLVGDRVVVELGLSKDITLTTDCRVAIRNVGMMGERVIAVDLKTTGTPYAPQDLIQGEYEQGLGEVMGRLGEAVDALAALSVELKQVTGTMTRDGNLALAVRNFGQTSEELRLTVAENRANLRTAIQDFAAVSKSAKSLVTDREQQLRKAIDDFAAAAEKMDRLSGRLDSLRAVIQNVSTRIDRGEGTLGKLVQDDQLYGELSQSVQSFKALVEDIKAHPKKYLRFSVF